MKRRSFLLLISSPELQEPHARIVQALQFHSDGDFIEILKQTSAPRGAKVSGEPIPFVVAYLFSTETPPSQMSFGTLTHDRYVLVEVGQATWVDGFSRVRAWLERHAD